MVNYACAFSQSELGKYFEWIIKLFNKLSKIYKYINTSNNSSQNSLIYFMLVILASSSYSIPIIPRGSFQVACEKKNWGSFGVGDHFASCLGRFWGSFEVGDHFGSCTNLTAQSTASHRGIGSGIQIPETYLQSLLSFLFPPWRQSSPESLLASYLELEAVTRSGKKEYFCSPY